MTRRGTMRAGWGTIGNQSEKKRWIIHLRQFRFALPIPKEAPVGRPSSMPIAPTQKQDPKSANLETRDISPSASDWRIIPRPWRPGESRASVCTCRIWRPSHRVFSGLHPSTIGISKSRPRGRWRRCRPLWPVRRGRIRRSQGWSMACWFFY